MSIDNFKNNRAVLFFTPTTILEERAYAAGWQQRMKRHVVTSLSSEQASLVHPTPDYAETIAENEQAMFTNRGIQEKLIAELRRRGNSRLPWRRPSRRY